MAADLAIVGARIRTLDPGRPAARAVAVAGGTVVAVGGDDEVRAVCDRRTEVLDGRGLTVTPGLVDAHIHALRGALRLVGADCSAARTPDEVRSALRAERARVARAGSTWVRGHSLRYEAFAGGALHAARLGGVLGDAPAFLTFFDFHTALATPPALRAAGLWDAPPRLEGSAEVVVRDGAPTGELREEAAMDLVRAAMPALAAGEARAVVEHALGRMNAAGLTGAHVMDGTPATHQVLRSLEDAGRLTLRMVVPFQVDPATGDDELADLLHRREARGALWRGGVLKLYADGVVETGTAWLEEPDAHGRGLTSLWPDPARYAEVVRRGSDAGFQVATHAIGDRAIRSAVEAYAATGAARERRHRIEHLETLPDGDLERIAAEGIVASQQAIHLQWSEADGGDPWAAALGPARAARAFRCGDLRRVGATLALGSDWPVADFDPRLGMAWARLRREPGRPERAPLQPEQRLDAVQALEGYTTHAARAVGEEAVAGRIAVGMRADLTAFAQDPVAVAADDLPAVPIALTIVGGRVVHRA